MRLSLPTLCSLLPALQPSFPPAPRAPSPRLALGATYSVRLPKPLGIVFEESEPGEPQGVVVGGLVEAKRPFFGSNAVPLGKPSAVHGLCTVPNRDG